MEEYLSREVLNREQLETKRGKCLPNPHYPVKVFEFITNLSCKRDCVECVRKPLHSLLFDYECKVEEIKTFVELAERHHRIFSAIRLSGGDALLWSGLDPVQKIRIKVDGLRARYVQEHHWHETQQFEPQPDGSVIVQFEVVPNNELINWILKLGSNAEVLEPESLRQEIKTEITKMQRRYE
jgi:hypothetical protein